MLMLIVYGQWRGISFLGGHFSTVAIGRKFCILILVCLVSAFVGLCWIDLVCGRRLLFLVLCRRRGYLSWGYWCPCWCHWSGFGYTAGKHYLTNVPWSWLFLGTLQLGRVPWQTLTVWSGYSLLCVRIPVFLHQRKVFLPLVNLLSSMRWLSFCDAPPIPCLLVWDLLSPNMSQVGWWYPPRCALGRGLWLSDTVSLWHFWPPFSVCGMLGRPCQLDGGSCCRGKVLCVFCKIVFPISEE